jgi:PemK-like, MazF-like toxin of type II toxin-antitoxin system
VSFPAPVPALVIRYAYLWRSEHARGLEEGKDRPCAVILVTMTEDDQQVVTVLPVTHSPPSDPQTAVEIPAATKRRLGLDAERSWIMVDDANQFVWPGPDLHPARSGDASSVAYGLLPDGLFKEVQKKFARAIAKVGTVVTRTE